MTQQAKEDGPRAITTPGMLLVRVLIVTLCLIWGSTWVVIAEGLRDLPPMTSLGVRFVIAGIAFALIAPRLARLEGGGRPTIGLSLVHAILILAVPYAVIYHAETKLPSGLVSVLWSVYPIMLAVSAHVLLPKERMRPLEWAGLIVGFLGVAFMFWTDVRTIGPEAIPVALFLLISPFVSALGNCLIKRSNVATSSALMNRNGTLIAGATICVLAWSTERDIDVQWSGAAIFSIVYLALIGTVLAFGIYFWLLRHAPATYLSLIAFGIPAIALTLGALVGGEVVRAHTIGGMVLILGGVALILRAKSQARHEARERTY
jgi:drug/metabolite transporter (DMT)-like permease